MNKSEIAESYVREIFADIPLWPSKEYFVKRAIPIVERAIAESRGQDCGCGNGDMCPQFVQPVNVFAEQAGHYTSTVGPMIKLGDGEPSSAPLECGYFDSATGKTCGKVRSDRVHYRYGNDVNNEWMHQFEASGAAQEVSPVGSVQKITGPERPRCPVCGAETTCLSCKTGVEEVSPPSPEEHLCDFPLDPKHEQEFACYGCGSIWKWCKHENEWGTIGQIEGGGL